MRKLLFLILILGVAVATSHAAAKISVIPPGRVAEGEKFAVTVRVTDGEVGGRPSAPAVSGCTLIFGPAVATASSTSIVNGHSTTSSRTDFTFTYRADKAGTYMIPAVEVKVNGVVRTTSPVRFTVDPPGQRHQGGVNKPVSIDDIDSQSSSRPVNPNDVFVRILLSKPTAYEQEAIECTIKLYTKFGISEFFPTLQPSFDGFLIQEVELQPSLNQIEELNGQRYMTAILKKCIIFPQKAGHLTINSGEYDITVVQYDRVNMGYFSVSSPTPSKMKVNSNSASIDIKPLPEPRPAGFSGAVGTFEVEPRLIGNRHLTGEASSIIYTVKGTGDIKYVKEPVVTFPDDFDVYDTKSDFEGGVRGDNVTGVMKFDYTFVPRSIGDYKVRCADFIYFDLEKQQYVTLPGRTFDLKVEKGKDRPREEIETGITDILPVVTGIASGGRPEAMVYSPLYWFVYAALLMAMIAAVLIYRRHLRLAADVEGSRRAKADKVARNRLRNVKKIMDAGDSEKFYAAMLQAVWGYLGDKLSMGASQLTRDNVRDSLQAYGAPDEVADMFVNVLDTCEMARYTPSESRDRMTQVYDDTLRAVNAMERVKSSSKANSR